MQFENKETWETGFEATPLTTKKVWREKSGVLGSRGSQEPDQYRKCSMQLRQGEGTCCPCQLRDPEPSIPPASGSFPSAHKHPIVSSSFKEKQENWSSPYDLLLSSKHFHKQLLAVMVLVGLLSPEPSSLSCCFPATEDTINLSSAHRSCPPLLLQAPFCLPGLSTSFTITGGHQMSFFT